MAPEVIMSLQYDAKAGELNETAKVERKKIHFVYF